VTTMISVYMDPSQFSMLLAWQLKHIWQNGACKGSDVPID
jgi:hypothetical protein